MFIWQDGKKYVGSYRDDLKEGYGELIWPDKKIYKGNWKNGLQHGEGAVYLADGQMR